MLGFLKRHFQPVSLKKASLLLAVASVLSYLAGLIRDMLITFYFGASVSTDVFYSAFMIPDFVFAITTAGALSGVFLPMFRAEYLKDKQQALVLSGSFLFWAMILVLAVSGVCFLLMPLIVDLAFDKATVAMRADIVTYSRILLLSPILFTLSNFVGSALMTFKHYLSYALSPFLYNIGIITSTIFWQEEYGILSAVMGVVIGLLLHLGVRCGDLFFTEFEFKLAFYHVKLKDICKLSLFKMVSMISLVLSMLVFSSKAYGMTEGSVTAFNLARNLQSFVVSLFGISLATAAFPFIVDHKNNNKPKALQACLKSTALRILIWSFPAMLGMYFVAPEMITLFFERGAFDVFATSLTVSILLIFVLSIPFECINHLLARIYYAHFDTLRPALASFLFLLINVAGAFYVASWGEPMYLAMVFVLASIVQFSILLLMLEQRVHFFDWSFIKNLLKIIVSSLWMGLIVYLVGFWDVNLVLLFVLKIIAGILAYGLALGYLKIFKYTGIELRKFLC